MRQCLPMWLQFSTRNFLCKFFDDIGGDNKSFTIIILPKFEFAKKIFAILQIKTSIIPISSKEYKRAATRPKYSAMNNGGLLRHWQEALHDYLESKNLLND